MGGGEPIVTARGQKIEVARRSIPASVASNNLAATGWSKRGREMRFAWCCCGLLRDELPTHQHSLGGGARGGHRRKGA